MYKRQNPYIKMYRKRPRFDFSNALQAHKQQTYKDDMLMDGRG